MRKVEESVAAVGRGTQRTLSGGTLVTGPTLSAYNAYSHEKGRTPIHNWYTTVAGYSTDFVLGTLKTIGIQKGDSIFDPFAGTGTTALASMPRGMRVQGIEANPFHHLVACTKLDFAIDRDEATNVLATLRRDLRPLLESDGAYTLKLAPTIPITEHLSSIKNDEDGPPEMPHLARWMSPLVLERTLVVKAAVDGVVENGSSTPVGNLVRVAFGSILIPISNMQLAGPKIAYRRQAGKRVMCMDAPVVGLFLKKLAGMVSDLNAYKEADDWIAPEITLGDSRRPTDYFESEVDLAVTSPPYLNEVDYIENTRLELFFLGLVRSEADLRVLKERLIRANSKYLFKSNRNYPDDLPDLRSFSEVRSLCRDIERIWTQRGWGWDHPRLVGEYFFDMASHLRGMHLLLRKGAHYVLVVGDSAIDGVLVPTDKLIARIARDVGFHATAVTPFRWRSSSRHRTRLQESIIDLTA